MRLVLVALLLAIPTGCEKAVAERPSAHLVAKVNGTEISIREVRGV